MKKWVWIVVIVLAVLVIWMVFKKGGEKQMPETNQNAGGSAGNDAGESSQQDPVAGESSNADFDALDNAVNNLG